MTKKNRNNRLVSRYILLKILLGFVVIATIGYTIHAATAQNQTNNSILLSLMGPANTPTIKVTPSQTHNQTDIAHNLTIVPTFIWPTPTPIIISNTIDVSPELDDMYKLQVTVVHPNGIVDNYNVGPVPVDSLRTPPLTDNLRQKLALQPGDKILFVESIASLQSHHEPTASPTSATHTPPGPTDTFVPYPAPETTAPNPVP